MNKALFKNKLNLGGMAKLRGRQLRASIFRRKIEFKYSFELEFDIWEACSLTECWISFPGDNVADLKDVVFWLCRGFSEGFDIVSSYSVGRSEFLIQCLKIFAERCRSQRIAKLEQDRAFRFLITTQNERISKFLMVLGCSVCGSMWW